MSDLPLTDGQWPPVPPARLEDTTEFERIRYKAAVDEAAASLRDVASAAGRGVPREWEEEKQNWRLSEAAMQAEYALRKSIHDARVELSRGGIERAQRGAEAVRTAAAAIGTVYTGTAGLAFAVKDGRALPATGIMPALFLGVAIVFSAAYTGWLRSSKGIAPPLPHSSLQEYQDRRLNAFTELCTSLILSRAYALHVAVLGLGAGVSLLPLPFLSVPSPLAWSIGAALLIITLLFQW